MNNKEISISILNNIDSFYNLIKIVNKDRYKIDVIPALIIDGNIVSKGAVLTDREIKRYIKELCME